MPETVGKIAELAIEIIKVISPTELERVKREIRKREEELKKLKREQEERLERLKEALVVGDVDAVMLILNE